MNKSSKLLLLIVTAFLLASSIQVECRRTYSSRSSSSGRGNRGKNQPSSGGLFSSWLGGSKSSSSGSGSISKPAPTSAKKNWQTASSAASGQSKPSSGWANPYHKPEVPSAPKQTSYGWKPATGANTNAKPVSSYPSSNIGTANRGYPVQSGVQQSSGSYGGFKPVASAPSATNYHPSNTAAGGYKPANAPNTGYHPSGQTGYHQPNTGYHPSGQTGYHPPGQTGYHPPGQTGYHPPGQTGYHPPGQTGYHPPGQTGYHPPGQTGYHPPNTGYHPTGHQTAYGGYSASNHHPTGGHYPQQPGYSSGSYHSPSYSGYSPHTSLGGAAPSYQGTKLFGGSSGHYGYPGSGSWGIDTYGARKKSSGTGKLLTGLAVGAAGGYLTSSLVNRISNPWKYSGFGYGYGSSLGGLGGYGLGYGGGYGGGYDAIRVRDESAFERGYERGIQAKLNENSNNNNNNNNNKEAPAPPPEDPTSKWIQCVAFDPQTQQTLINPNCSCTVTTSVDERTGQPLSVHHCTTLNGLVMRPIPVQPGVAVPVNQPFEQPAGGVNGQPSGVVSGQSFSGPPGEGASGPTFDGPPPGSVNGPPSGVSSGGVAPSYFPIAYGDEFQYNGGATVYIPPRPETRSVQSPVESKPFTIPDKTTTESKTEQSSTEPKLELTSTESKPDQSTTGSTSETSTGTVPQPEVTARVQKIESVVGGSKIETPPMAEGLGGGLGGEGKEQKRTDEFFGQLQKIVNMGNFVDGG